mgnify:CR=1 FL=1
MRGEATVREERRNHIPDKVKGGGKGLLQSKPAKAVVGTAVLSSGASSALVSKYAVKPGEPTSLGVTHEFGFLRRRLEQIGRPHV